MPFGRTRHCTESSTKQSVACWPRGNRIVILLDLIRQLLEWGAGLVGHIPMARAVLGSILVLVLPGLSWSLVLFRGKQISVAERLAISAGISIAAGTLSIFAANRIVGLSITGTNSALVLITMTAVPLVWLGLRKIWRKRKDALGRDVSSSQRIVGPAGKPLQRLLKSDLLKLAPILGLAFFIAYIPHLNYPFPLHVDEWFGLVSSKAIMQAQDLTYLHPLSGTQVMTPWVSPEIGFHLFLGVFQRISGISWLAVFRYLPSIIFLLTALGVYIVTNREGFGWESAFFASLIPTTVGILGPSFLVPVALGLTFLPLSLFVAFHLRGWRACAVLLVFSAFLFSMHAPSGVVVALILVPYIIVNLKKQPWYALGMAAALLAPSIAFLLTIQGHAMPSWGSLLGPAYPTQYVQLPLLIQIFGYLSMGLCLVGVMVLTIKGGTRKLCLLLGLLTVLLMLFVFFALHRGVGILFERGLMFAMLMMSLVAGAGLMAIRQLRLPRRILSVGIPRLAQNGVYILCAALVGATMATVVPARLNQPYYHVIDDADFDAWQWIADNVPAEYSKAIVDPWKSTAFSAITSKNVYTEMGAAANTAFMRSNSISIVYSLNPVSNPDLVQVKKNVYLLKKP